MRNIKKIFFYQTIWYVETIHLDKRSDNRWWIHGKIIETERIMMGETRYIQPNNLENRKTNNWLITSSKHGIKPKPYNISVNI